MFVEERFLDDLHHPHHKVHADVASADKLGQRETGAVPGQVVHRRTGQVLHHVSQNIGAKLVRQSRAD